MHEIEGRNRIRVGGVNWMSKREKTPRHIGTPRVRVSNVRKVVG